MDFILAGTQREALDYCHLNGLNPHSHEVVIISEAWRLKGHKIARPLDKLHRVGNYYARTDFPQIQEELKLMGYYNER